MKTLITQAIAVIFCGTIAVQGYMAYGTTAAVTAEVTEKYIKRNGGSDRYMVAARIGGTAEVFENTDSFLHMKFDSADVQAAIAPGGTCTFKVNGWRVPVLNWNRNILRADCAA